VANEQWNQSYGDQAEAYQGPIEQPTTCNGEEGERAGDADGEQIQAQGNELSHDGEPIHCGEESTMQVNSLILEQAGSGCLPATANKCLPSV